MGLNPLDSAWKIAKEFSDRRAAAPSELNYFANRGHRDAIEERAYEYFTDLYKMLERGEFSGARGEMHLLVRACLLSTWGYPILMTTIIKLWWLQKRLEDRGLGE